MIVETPTTVTITDDRGQSRTFHPNGKEEVLQLDGVPVGVTAKREAGRLVVLYGVEQGRDLQRGQLLFQTCAACHSDKPDSLGPSLTGVIGRKAGSRDDFRYSNAMMRAGFTWDAGSLHQYLTDPQAKVKGNRMPFSGLSDPKDVDDVIAYIGTLK